MCLSGGGRCIREFATSLFQSEQQDIIYSIEVEFHVTRDNKRMFRLIGPNSQITHMDSVYAFGCLGQQ